MEREDQRRIVEALILGSAEPLSDARIADIIPYVKPKKVRELVEELNVEYVKQNRSFEISEVAGGYEIRTLPEFAPYLQQTLKTRPLRLSQAALETLAVIAYRQPVTRGEIEHIRGVDVGAVLRSLVERKLVRIAGHRDVPGRPMLYGTTRRFLEVFELGRIEDLPTLRDLRELAPEGGLEEAPVEGAQTRSGVEASPDAEASPPDAEPTPSEADAPAQEGQASGEPPRSSQAVAELRPADVPRPVLAVE